MAAATLAHCGFGGQGDVQFCPALKTEDASLLNDRLWRSAGGGNGFLKAEVLAALLADRRVSTARLRLCVPALRANNRNRLCFCGRHGDALRCGLAASASQPMRRG